MVRASGDRTVPRVRRGRGEGVRAVGETAADSIDRSAELVDRHILGMALLFVPLVVGSANLRFLVARRRPREG